LTSQKKWCKLVFSANLYVLARIQAVASKIDQVVRKTRRYWYDDGFVEIGTGILLSLVAVWLASRNFIPQTSPWFDIVTRGLPMLIMGLGLAGSIWIRTLKERITYVRSGYVAFDKNGRWRSWLALVLAAGMGLPLLVGYMWHTNQALVAGLVFATGYASLGRYFNVVRFYGLGLVAILSGVAASFLPNLNGLLGTYFVLGGLGVGMTISGLLVLHRYLAENPPEVSHDK
jgi:hypothetical protein